MYVCKKDMSSDQIWQCMKENPNPPEGFYIDFENIPDYIINMNSILVENNYGDTTKEMVWGYARDYEYEPDYERIFANLVIADFIEFCKEKNIPHQSIHWKNDFYPFVLIENDGKWVEFEECGKDYFVSQGKKYA